MKFFATAAVVALAAGSAVAHAIPPTDLSETKAMSGFGLPAGVPAFGKAPVETQEVGVPVVELPRPTEVEDPELGIPEYTRRQDVEVEAGKIEAEVSEVTKVTKDVTVIVEQVKLLVSEDLANIVEAIRDPGVDADSLLSLITDLKSHVEVLLEEVVSKLVALVFKAASLEEVDLEIVSALLFDINSIVAEVETTLQTIVESDLKLEILAVVLAQIQATLSLLSIIITSVVQFALAVVSGLDVTAIVTRITSTVGDLEQVLALVGSVLDPLLKPLAV